MDHLTFIETAHYLSMTPYNTRLCRLLQVPVKRSPSAVALVQPELGLHIPGDTEGVSWTNHVYVFPWPPRQWDNWQAGCLTLSSILICLGVKQRRGAGTSSLPILRNDQKYPLCSPHRSQRWFPVPGTQLVGKFASGEHPCWQSIHIMCSRLHPLVMNACILMLTAWMLQSQQATPSDCIPWH